MAGSVLIVAIQGKRRMTFGVDTETATWTENTLEFPWKRPKEQKTRIMPPVITWDREDEPENRAIFRGDSLRAGPCLWGMADFLRGGYPVVCLSWMEKENKNGNLHPEKRRKRNHAGDGNRMLGLYPQ